MQKIKYLVFVISLLISIIIVNDIIEDKLEEHKIELNKIGNEISKEISDKVNKSVSSVFMNEILLINHNYDTSKFETWAPLIILNFSDLNSIQLAPNGIVKHIYPLKGNEKAIGHNLLKDPTRREAAYKAMHSNKTTFIGPIKLIQNNKYAVIIRKPIAILKDNQKDFWGFSTALIHVENILSHINIKLDEEKYAFAVYGNNPDLKEAPLFLSSKTSPNLNASKYEIEVPNGKWQLIIETINKDYNSNLLYFVGLLISFFIALVVHVYFRDIQKEKNKFIQIIDNSSDNIHIINDEGKITEASNTFAKTLGYEKNEILGKHISTWETKEDLNNIYNINKIDNTVNFYTKYKRKNGSYFDVLVTLSKIIFDDKTYINASIKDATDSFELKKIKKLQEEQSKLIETLDEIEKISKIGYWNYDFESDIFVCSKEFENIYKINEKESLILKSIEKRCHPEDKELLNKTFENSYKKEGNYKLKYRIMINDDIKYIELIWKTFTKDGRTYKTEGSAQDITEKVLEKEEKEKQKLVMLNQQRLAQQGEMLEMIGHQWKQPISILSLNSQVCEMLLSGNKDIPEEIIEKLKNNTEICHFMGQTISDFKQFFSEEKKEIEFTLEKLLEDTLVILSQRIKISSINVEKNLTSIVSKQIKGFKTELGQVILAISNNAIDILEEKDINKKLIFNISEHENNQIKIEIQDNAGGIPEDVLPNIFDAYFSTKKEKNGTGLGLHMTKMIVENSFKGTIRAYNKNYGACFEIIIPS